MTSPLLSSLPLAFVDLETTGLDPDARIIQVAVVHLDPGHLPRVAFSSLVAPGIPLPERVTNITGITPEDLEGAPIWEEVAPRVLAAIGDRPISAYNAPADYTWLKNECARVGLIAPGWPWIDVLVLAKSEHCDKFAKGGKKQIDVARRRGIAVDAHGAAGDAVTTALLWPLLSREVGVYAEQTLADFLDDQREEALGQERDFVQYLIRQGLHGDRPDCPWHALEGMEPPAWPPRRVEVGRCPTCSAPAVYRVAKDGTVALEDPSTRPHSCAPATDIPYQDVDIPF